METLYITWACMGLFLSFAYAAQKAFDQNFVVRKR
jgi:hypothetical protein